MVVHSSPVQSRPDSFLGLMAKWPAAGRVKTRLSPPLRPAEAAQLYAAFIADLCRELTGVAAETVLLFAGAPPDIDLEATDAPRRLGAALPRDWPRWPEWPVRAQRGADLGERLAAAFTDLGPPGSPVVLLGADHPDLPRAEVEAAFAALEQADLVVGPSLDGGYYLIGLSRPEPGLFTGMPWSSPELLAATLNRAAELGLRVTATRPWYDIDRPQDLAFLRQHLRLIDASGGRLQATAAVLAHLIS